jgi:KDEL-tailed cysteine endopeptidase
MNYICEAIAYWGIYECVDANLVVMEQKFQNHISSYGLSYGTEEEYQFRFDQFAMTDAELERINSDPENLYIVDHNQFSTLTKAEFKRILGRMPAKEHATFTELPTANLSGAVDWRTKGAVNPVQDQGQCGSCWAFSSTAAMEGAHFIATGKLLKLAEQQFVDCDTQSSGCNGGLEEYAFQYAKSNPQELETDYPYTARTGKCHADKTKEIVSALSFVHVPAKSDAQLKAAIDAQPTCVAVEADTDFQFYSKGILNAKNCGTNLDHAITAVGYGADASGNQYYIVRNSWGASWGESGYIRIAAGKDGDGVCGILLDSTRPSTN